MIDSPIADLPARVWTSRTGTEFVGGRVVMSHQRLILESAGSRTSIPVSTIFDIAPGQAPGHLDRSTEAIVTVGFFTDETRHAAAIEADEETVQRLTLLLFESVLHNVDVILVDPGWVDGQLQSTPPLTALLTVSRDRVSIRSGGQTTSIKTTEVIRFERVAVGKEGTPITVGLCRWIDGSVVRVDFTFDSRYVTNVFGRYLRTYSDAVGESSAPITVLFVDDEPALADTIASLIEEEDDRIETCIAASAVEGLELLAQHPDIDCVVSDYRMPDLDGIGFLDAVRQTRPNLPFILLTGQGSEEVAERALAKGVSDYIRKGSLTEQYDELADRIERAVLQLRPHTYPSAGSDSERQ